VDLAEDAQGVAAARDRAAQHVPLASAPHLPRPAAPPPRSGSVATAEWHPCARAAGGVRAHAGLQGLAGRAGRHIPKQSAPQRAAEPQHVRPPLKKLQAA
jgi:hypothetical protein